MRPCVPDPEVPTRGFCMPEGCTTAQLAFCLASVPDPMSTSLEERFGAGDCDGDLILNRDDTGRLCDGATVVTRTGTGFSAVRGARLDVADGGHQVGPDAWSSVPGSFAVGCGGAWDCPRVPDQPVRCVFLPVGAGSTAVGACTYLYSLHDDMSCVDPAGGVGAVDPCFGDAPSPYEEWAEGDCDGDGLINKQDGPVCRAAQVIGILEGGIACRPGHFSELTCMGERRVQVGSSHYACSPELAAGTGVPTAFAVCCAGGHDCPAADDPSERGRCVRLPVGDGSLRGACLYDRELVEDDFTCETVTGSIVSTCELIGAEYGTWAEGDCDHCMPRDSVNRLDDAVCGCRAPAIEAGMPPTEDGGNATPADSGNASLEDAAVSAEDAGPVESIDADVEPPPPPSVFAGSGCRCAAAGSGVSRRGLPWLLALAAGLALGRPLLRRRKR